MKNKKSELERKSLSEIPFIGGVGVVLLYLAIFYGITSLSNRSLNYKKWPEIERKEEKQELFLQQQTYRQQFQRLDKNKDYVIDTTEFIYRK